MSNGSRKDSIVISLAEVGKKRGIVILDLKEYEKLRERAVPTYYLTGKEAEELDNLVREGVKEYEAGETIKASSMKEALNLYDRQRSKRR